MSRCPAFLRCLALLGGWYLFGVSLALAQPTLLTERQNLPRFQTEYKKSFALPGRRFVHCADTWVYAQGRSKIELAFVVSTLAGDTVRSRRLNLNVLNGGDYFVDVVLEPDYSLTFLSAHYEPNPVPTLPGENTIALTQIDTLGRVRWQRRTPATDVVSISGLLRVPDGYLALVNPLAAAASTPTARYAQAGLAKFDRQGALLWRRTWPSRGYGGVGELAGLVARPDGSYLAAGYADDGTFYAGGAAAPRRDNWLVQFSATGDTLRTARFGVRPQFETSLQLFNTRDGGAVLSGVRRLPTSPTNDAQLVKVDSLLRPQWTYTQPNTSNYDDAFRFVQPTTRGDILFGGGRYDWTTRQLAVNFTAYTASGLPRWTRSYNFGGAAPRLTGLFSFVSRPDSSAYIMGGTLTSVNSTTYDDYFAHFANMGVPYVADLCRVPPQALFGYLPPATGSDSLQFVNASNPGPRYAVLALLHWDFGDGTSFDGPAPPPHRFATRPPGQGITLTVTNNLGCTSTAVLYPFAPAATAAARVLAAQLQLYPNPTAGAVTLALAGLRPQAAVGLTVLNALGQVVLARQVAVRQGTLREDLALAALPPGVYTVRLRTQEGALTKRLVRE